MMSYMHMHVNDSWILKIGHCRYDKLLQDNTKSIGALWDEHQGKFCLHLCATIERETGWASFGLTNATQNWWRGWRRQFSIDPDIKPKASR